MLDEAGAKVIVTADHGNAEQMLEGDGAMNTAHSTGMVPLVVLDKNVKLEGRRRAQPTWLRPCCASWVWKLRQR